MMPTFHYTAASASAGIRRGTAVAPDMESLARDLRRQGVVVLDMQPQNALTRFWALLNKDVTGSGSIKTRDLISLTFEWGSLLNSGVSVETTLAISAGGASTPARKALIGGIRKKVLEGSPLHRALQTSETRFSSVFLAIVTAAEEASALGPAILRFSTDLSTKQQQTEEIRNALLYPAFILVTAGAAIAVLLGIVVPNIESLFGANGLTKLPLVTRLVIGLSHFLRALGIPLLFLGCTAITAIILWSKTDRGGLEWSRLLLRLPWMGNTLQLVNTGLFLRLLAELTSAGVGLARAVPLASSAVSNRFIRQSLASVQIRVTEGGNLADALLTTGALPSDAIQLVRVGEQTGRLKELSAQAASMYELRGRTRMKTLTTIIGPAFTVGFGLAAGIVVYAIMTTILSINGLAFQ